MDVSRLAIVDVETTGGGARADRVIEVAVVLTRDGEIEHTWSTLVNPERSIPPMITSLTGIQPTQLFDAPVFQEIAEHLRELLSDRVFVAHNVRFDYGFLRQEFQRLGQPWRSPHLCSVRVSRRLFPHFSGHSLDKIIQRHAIPVSNRHRALDDALAVAQFFQLCKQNVGPDAFHATCLQLLHQPSRPPQVPATQLESLPSCPGVYIFWDALNHPLYVGKSVDIKDRVLSHFYADLTESKERRMKEAVHHIETRTTAGELEALLLESRLVKELQPVFNVRLRRSAGLLVLTQETNPSGYHTLKLERRSRLTANELASIITVFHTASEAHQTLDTLAQEHHLCKKVLGIEKGRGACFGSHIEQCPGACTGNEPPISHNVRFQKAVRSIQLGAWPLRTPLTYTEYNPITEQSTLHVFSQWCHLGSFPSPDGWQMSLADTHSELLFDLDTYHIIRRFLKEQPRRFIPFTTGF